MSHDNRRNKQYRSHNSHVLYDSSDYTRRSRRRYSSSSSPKRRRSRDRSPSPQILNAILEGHVTEKLEVLTKSYEPTVSQFKQLIRCTGRYDPYEFTPQPVLISSLHVETLIEESRALRESVSKKNDDSLKDARVALQLAELDVHEIECRLKSVQAQLATYASNI